MPPSHIKTGLAQLKTFFDKRLTESRISFSEIKTYGTPRRMVVFIDDISKKQSDGEEPVIGPPKSAAFDENGQPRPAAEGFARTHGIKVKQLEIINTEKGEYVGYVKKLKGKSTHEVLSQIVPEIISSLSFPKTMKWGTIDFKFSRPIKNILAILDGKAVEFSVAGINSNDFSMGHKIYSPEKVKIASFKKYQEMMIKNLVVINPEERKSLILNSFKEKLFEIKGELKEDEELLDWLVYSVEYPYVFWGNFPEKYLNLPLEVLSTALKEGQKLFSVLKNREQLPVFISVADAPEDPKEYIKKGNERVLIARLEDAEFFWSEDRKIPLKERVSALEKVIYQEKLGSYLDKTERMKKIVAYLIDQLKLKRIKEYAVQAAELAKADLTTEMVKEFPVLQGKIGGLYLKEEGYPEEVWSAVFEHYKPLSLEDNAPASLTGALLSLTDKIDSLIGASGIGLEVSGSKDPFGLRRLAHGICKIIIDNSLSFSFFDLVNKTIDFYQGRLIIPREKINEYVSKFFENRLRYIYQTMDFRYDLINSSLGAGIDNLYHTFLRLEALNKIKDRPNFGPLIITSKRVNNIILNQPEFKLKLNLLKEKEEKELYDIYSTVKGELSPLISSGEFNKAQEVIVNLRPFVDNFFDRVLVMTDDKKLRENRLALLQEISKLFLKLADFSKIVIEE